MPASEITVLLALVDQAFKGPAWHGPALLGTLRGVTAEEALRRPAPGRHNVWELVLHAAYWKHIVRRRITGDDSLTFPRSPADWPALPSEPSEAAWKKDKELLKREHALLRAAVAKLSAKDLKGKGTGTRWRRETEVIGIASHDLYHGGQIGLVKRLVGA